ncbi:hypothetical protein TanjilG_20260 [Lupinus angustifolius]|uniref:Major facilitator superfamily (MFS) profile domain-containing protein n=1 Tax=Lupinus angustifolius TaxID=3871 RepID=A0A1J7H5W7_LUPAN|nr:hypothetical protein TanjilG_20260 [Lupinus angustifolius]
MIIEQHKDVESGESSGLKYLQEPFIQQGDDDDSSASSNEVGSHKSVENGSIGMVLLSTLVAVCGSFSFGTCVGYSAPTQAAIRADLNLSLAELLIVTGASVSFLLGSIINWRVLALTGLVPCISLLIGLWFIPESPRWLAKVGREKDFLIALRRLRGKDVDISYEAQEIMDYVQTLQSLPKIELFDLFQSKHVHSVVIGVGLMVCQQSCGINGIGFYTAETFVAAGLSSGKAGTIAYACIQIPFTALGAILMDKSGRRPLIRISASGTFLGCFITGIAFFLKASLSSKCDNIF